MVADAPGMRITERDERDPRLRFYRFDTDAISWDPGVNVCLPDGYHAGEHRYPVLYLLHGGLEDCRTFHHLGILEWTVGKPIIVVMPDGGRAGWYSNPVSSLCVPPERNWETFHMSRLLPWIDANFRTYAEAEGRAVAGFSMGGFGALKYAAKYFGHFASVSSHSGPADLRHDGDFIVRWANASSFAVELCGGMVYGELPAQDRVTADNPMENVERYRGKRIFLVAGTGPGAINWFDAPGWIDRVHETTVLTTQKNFRAALQRAGIPHRAHEEPGGHFVRKPLIRKDIDGIVARLRPAATRILPRPTGTHQGTRHGWVGIYPQGGGWNGANPSDTYFHYGAHNLVDQYGIHRILNNQTGNAGVRLCTGFDGTDRGGKLAPGSWADVDLTPINSIVLEP